MQVKERLEILETLDKIMKETTEEYRAAIFSKIQSRVKKELPEIISMPASGSTRCISSGPKVIDFPVVDPNIHVLTYVLPLFDFEIENW